jgi:hypothetical protein
MREEITKIANAGQLMRSRRLSNFQQRERLFGVDSMHEFVAAVVDRNSFSGAAFACSMMGVAVKYRGDVEFVDRFGKPR